MRSWSLRLGRFFGIDVFVHWTFSILLVWIFLMHISGGHGAAGGIAGVFFVLALFACVVLHEFGHALTAARFGIKTKDITLYPIGGIASLEGMPEKPSEELLVGLAGPLVNLGIALVIWVYLSATGQLPGLAAVAGSDDMASVPFLWNLLFANVVLAVFNLIPAFPMDGGRVLRSLLSFMMDKSNATRAAAALDSSLRSCSCFSVSFITSGSCSLAFSFSSAPEARLLRKPCVLPSPALRLGMQSCGVSPFSGRTTL